MRVIVLVLILCAALPAAATAGNSGSMAGMAMPDTGNRGHEGEIPVSSLYQQALGVRTGTVGRHDFGQSIHAYGQIVPDMRREYAVTVRTAGWIADLATDAVGDMVKKGDLLFTFYSPDLMQAQSDFMVGNRVGNAEQRLRLYGMDDKAIAELKKQPGRFLEKTPFYAPADGTVSALKARRGAYMPEGSSILTLQDYAQVWVEAHVPLKDLQVLKPGTPATVTVDDTNETFKAAVDYIYPQTDPQSRDGMVRLVLDNPDGRLKTDALVDVAFTSDSHPRLAVPEEAVLYDKSGGHVIQALGDGYFKPVAIVTGITADGMTEILSGLEEGQSVVTSGQFMIDAESNLNAAMAGMDMPGMDMSHDEK